MRKVFLHQNSGENEEFEKWPGPRNFKMLIKFRARRLGTDRSGPSARPGVIHTGHVLSIDASGCRDERLNARSVFLRQNSDENEEIEKLPGPRNFKIIIFAARRLGADTNGPSTRPGVIHTGHVLSIDACRDGRLWQ